jgi:hypothetical protein
MVIVVDASRGGRELMAEVLGIVLLIRHGVGHRRLMAMTSLTR